MKAERLTGLFWFLVNPEDSSNWDESWSETYSRYLGGREIFFSIIKFFFWYGISIVTGLVLAQLH